MKKACKKCKSILASGTTCPQCGGTQLTDSWKGRFVVFNPEESAIAQKLNIKKAGNYAIKTR